VDVAGQAPQTVEIDDLDIPQPDPPLIEQLRNRLYPKWSKMNQHRLHNRWKLQGCKDQRESDSAQTVRTDNDRFEVLLCRNATGDPWRPTPRLPYVRSRRFLPV
jgi:hypothetical protein